MREVIRIPLRHVSTGRSAQSEWQVAGLILFTAALCVAALFWQTIQSMIDVWGSSRTFAHGVLVLPAAGYLIWSYRPRLVGLVPAPSAWGLLAIFFSGGGWVAGQVSQLLWLQQAAVVTALPGLVWTIYGTEIARTLSWPLGFLIFLLPVGTSVEPWLQDLTARLILIGLDVSGISYVYRDYYIAVESAIWEVAPDCGGLRYLLPGLSLAYAFAALTYRQPARRIMFLALCAVVLMMANGVRAYGVIVGNYIGIAAGADHRLFSYTIYGLTMPFLFWLGLKWKQRLSPDRVINPDAAHRLDIRKAIFASLCGVGLMLFARLAVWFFPLSF